MTNCAQFLSIFSRFSSYTFVDTLTYVHVLCGGSKKLLADLSIFRHYAHISKQKSFSLAGWLYPISGGIQMGFDESEERRKDWKKRSYQRKRKQETLRFKIVVWTRNARVRSYARIVEVISIYNNYKVIGKILYQSALFFWYDDQK